MPEKLTHGTASPARDWPLSRAEKRGLLRAIDENEKRVIQTELTLDQSVIKRLERETRRRSMQRDYYKRRLSQYEELSAPASSANEIQDEREAPSEIGSLQSDFGEMVTDSGNIYEDSMEMNSAQDTLPTMTFTSHLKNGKSELHHIGLATPMKKANARGAVRRWSFPEGEKASACKDADRSVADAAVGAGGRVLCADTESDYAPEVSKILPVIDRVSAEELPRVKTYSARNTPVKDPTTDASAVRSRDSPFSGLLQEGGASSSGLSRPRRASGGGLLPHYFQRSSYSAMKTPLLQGPQSISQDQVDLKTPSSRATADEGSGAAMSPLRRTSGSAVGAITSKNGAAPLQRSTSGPPDVSGEEPVRSISDTTRNTVVSKSLLRDTGGEKYDAQFDPETLRRNYETVLRAAEQVSSGANKKDSSAAEREQQPDSTSGRNVGNLAQGAPSDQNKMLRSIAIPPTGALATASSVSSGNPCGNGDCGTALLVAATALDGTAQTQSAANGVTEPQRERNSSFSQLLSAALTSTTGFIVDVPAIIWNNLSTRTKLLVLWCSWVLVFLLGYTAALDFGPSSGKR
ncbi:unnamed protein product [Amoebophrya sp. A25]|nr:unnamed protein product [Amoebophrya sp. A25]|eukprot:GSA25T00013368001.1